MRSEPIDERNEGRDVTDGVPGGRIPDWQEQLVRRTGWAMVYAGMPVLLIGSYNAYRAHHFILPLLYVVIYVVLAVVMLYPKIPHRVRATSLPVILYFLSVVDFYLAAHIGSGRLFLLLVPLLVTLFFGMRAGAASLVVAVLTVLGFGWAYASDRLAIRRVPPTQFSLWAGNAVVLLGVGVVLVASVGFVVLRVVAALESSRRLAEELREHRERLEREVKERTRALQEANYALQRRAIQLEAGVEVAQAITSIFDIDLLLSRTVELIRDRFGFYHAGIFLLDESGRWAVLREATGEAGAKMKAMGHRLAVGETSMVGWTALHRQPRIALYAEEDEVRFANPLLPHTRSEMTLPMMVGDRLLGVLNVQSVEEAAFDEDDVRTLQAMANQIAIALDNARKVSDEMLLLEATSPIYRVSRRLAQVANVQDVAEAIITSVQETGADGCVVVEFEYGDLDRPTALLYRGVWRRDREAQFVPGMRVPAEDSPFPFELVGTLWAIPDVEQDKHLPEEARAVFLETGVRAIANIPLRTRERVIGQVVVLKIRPGPFSTVAMRLYEALSDQAAVALERAQLWEATQQRAAREQLVGEISDRMQRATNMESLMQIAAEELNRALGGTHAYVHLMTEEIPVSA